MSDSISHLFEDRMFDMLVSMGGTPALLAHFGTDATTGPSPSVSIDERRQRWGANQLPAGEEVTFLGLWLEAMSDKLLLMLLVAAVVNIVLGMSVPNFVGCGDNRTKEPPNLKEGWIEGTAILISILVVSLVGSINNYRKAKKFEELSALTSKQPVSVVRDGGAVVVDSSEVVCGDLLVCTYGQIICADAIYLRGQDMKTEESAVTGESDLKRKDVGRDPFLISGSSVETGECVGLVVAVGESSFNGRQMMKTREPPRLTPLQEKLEALAEMIGRFGMGAAILTLVVLIVMELVYLYAVPSYCHYKTPDYGPFLEFVIIAIAIVVVAIPEGLPLAVTIALAYSMNQMMDDNCQVRHLSACETMGAATAICSDKTGTLTTNSMTVVQAWVAGGLFHDPGAGVRGLAPLAYPTGPAGGPDGTTVAEAVPEAAAALFVDAIVANSRAVWMRSEVTRVSPSGASVVEVEQRWQGGNKTEEALLRAAMAHQRWDPPELVAARNAMGDQRHVYPFNSGKKRQTVLLRGSAAARTSNATPGLVRVFVQGASEVVLADCARVVRPNGRDVALGAAERGVLERMLAAIAADGNRTLCLATAVHTPSSASWAACGAAGAEWPEEEPVVEDLALLAVVGIQDPIRPEVPNAVATCQRAGITVRMVTGDNIDTAKAIAAKCGIFGDDHVAMVGSAFRKLAADDPAALRALLPRLRVLARSSPTDKHVLAGALICGGDVVAMTGDGTNDAPALKLAHVGFAMNVGTAVAKAASDIVILDNNFVSVVKACMWGRNVNDAVKKFLQFQLTINFVGVLITFISAVASPQRHSLLRPVQLLWLNLVMDTFAALALATEGPTPALLEREPVYRQSPLVTRRMWAFIVGHGVYQLAVELVFIFALPGWSGLCKPGLREVPENGGAATCAFAPVHVTMVFCSFVLMQMANIFNARKLLAEVSPFSGLLRPSSTMFWGVTCLCVVFQVIVVEVPGINTIMRTVPLPWEAWVLTFAVALFELPVGLLIRLLPISEPPIAVGPDPSDEALEAAAAAAAGGGGGGAPPPAVTSARGAGTAAYPEPATPLPLLPRSDVSDVVVSDFGGDGDGGAYPPAVTATSPAPHHATHPGPPPPPRYISSTSLRQSSTEVVPPGGRRGSQGGELTRRNSVLGALRHSSVPDRVPAALMHR